MFLENYYAIKIQTQKPRSMTEILLSPVRGILIIISNRLYRFKIHLRVTVALVILNRLFILVVSVLSFFNRVFRIIEFADEH